MDFGVCSGTDIADESPRKRHLECHIKYDPKLKGKDIIYRFSLILLVIFSSISQLLHKGELSYVRTIPDSSCAVTETFTGLGFDSRIPDVVNR